VNNDTQQFFPVEIDKPFDGLVREYYLDRTIILYRLVAVSEQVVSDWENLVVDTLKNWNDEKPYLVIHDLSQAGISLQYAALVNFDMMNVGITLKGRLLTDDMFDSRPNLQAKVAVNFNLSLSGQTNRTLMNLLNRTHVNVKYKTFYNHNKCIKWLIGNVTDTSELKSVSGEN
jgi:hypothetical protein